ncbi:MAG: glycosyltransferase, partial [Solirubrobacterales bacterium]|nr:glycosyltransferase [Solirubrobacterales bacterium]
MPAREPVDIVVPFVGGEKARAALLARLDALELAPGDTVTVVDNGTQAPATDDDLRVLHAPERPSSYLARNRGAERGRAPWIVFLDADVVPPPGLVDAYFSPPPADDVAVLAGGVADEAPNEIAARTPAARYAALTAPMAQENTLGGRPGWSYAQTANVMVRRAAFAAIGGFDEHVRSAGDADLCFRLRDAGWTLEPRPGASVVHRNRTSLRALLRQRARHGSGTAWLHRAHPGSFPPHRSPGTVWW